MSEPTLQDAYDVIVVGSGFAGTAAALHAARAGASVLMVEKSESPGGSTAMSAGMYWTAPTFEAYLRRIPMGRADLGQSLVYDYYPCLDELRALGAYISEEPVEDIMTFGIGYSTDIREILRRSWDEIRTRNGTILTSTAARELLTEGRKVEGIRLEHADGSRSSHSSSSVVLATGGFQGDPALRSAYLGPNSDRLVFRSNPGSVGDGLRMAQRAGAGGSTAMSTFYGHLLPYPMTQFEPEHFLPYSQYYSSETLLVNLRGERFADEKTGDEILNQLILHQPEARGVLIFDEHVHRTEASAEPFPGLGVLDRVQVGIDVGANYCTAPTLGELIEQVSSWGIDGENLRATVSAYLRAVNNGGGTALGVPVAHGARAPEDAPFHALMVQPSITFTFGGIPITADGEVLDPDGRIIDGLFAAGSDIGGLSNEGYAGGLAPAYITGRWAGRAAAAHR